MKSLIANTLEELRDEEGLLRPDTIVEAASDAENVLHKYFEWDDGVAAHRHRLMQARTLIRQVKIPLRLGAVIVRAPAYVPSPTVVNAYERLNEVAPGSEHARMLVMDELTRVSGILGRARRIAAVLHLEAEIDELLVATAGLRSRMETATMAEPAPAPAAA